MCLNNNKIMKKYLNPSQFKSNEMALVCTIIIFLRSILDIVK
jgi:hypothetical protein